MLEEIIDALLLQQAAEEVEGGLSILDAIGKLLVGPFQVEAEIGEAKFLGQHLEDFLDRLVLEDTAICRPAQEPEPWPHRRLVFVMPLVVTELGEFADQPVEQALALPGGQFDRHHDGLAKDLIGVEVALLAEQVQFEVEGLAQPVGTRKLREQQDVLAKRGRQLDLAIIMGSWHVAP